MVSTKGNAFTFRQKRRPTCFVKYKTFNRKKSYKNNQDKRNSETTVKIVRLRDG